LRDEDFSCSLDVLYGGLVISKLQVFYQINVIFFAAEIFSKFLVIKTLDLDPGFTTLVSTQIVCRVKLPFYIDLLPRWQNRQFDVKLQIVVVVSSPLPHVFLGVAHREPRGGVPQHALGQGSEGSQSCSGGIGIILVYCPSNLRYVIRNI
jgi:hypothetical protein